MNSLQFGAQVNVHDLHPNDSRVSRETQRHANRLQRQFSKIGRDDLRIGIKAHQQDWDAIQRDLQVEPDGQCPKLDAFLRGSSLPTIRAEIEARSPETGEWMSAGVSRKIGLTADEPLRAFFQRVQTETNALLKTTGLT